MEMMGQLEMPVTPRCHKCGKRDYMRDLGRITPASMDEANLWACDRCRIGRIVLPGYGEASMEPTGRRR